LALWVGGEIFAAGGSKIAINLVPGTGGVFLVTLNGENVYDKSAEDRYPVLPDIKTIKDKVASLIT
jgi:selenoprotein W-related protein